jgi:protein-L-isoaspartate O-methyltransferase
VIPNQARLLRTLEGEGALSKEWRPAFEQVPRHLFVPDTAWLIENGRSSIDRAADEDAWLTAAYSDEPIITQWDDGASSGDSPDAAATSSISMPTIVAIMLRESLINDGMKVLEIGTGTGWNAALLAARLGDDNVYTVEVDPDITEAARVNLAKNGRKVTAVLADGAKGLPDHAPYDRVIATLSVSAVPYTWVTQTRPGGYIITPWRIPLLNGLLLRLRVNDDGTASGNFVNTAIFMPMRSQRPPNEDVPISEDAPVEQTAIDPREPINDDHAQFAIGLLVPECYEWTETTEHGFVQRLDDPSSGSWATVTINTATSGPYAVRQGGPRQLWDEVVSAYQWWQDAGSPVFTRFGVTVAREGQTVWLNHPGNVIAPAP